MNPNTIKFSKYTDRGARVHRFEQQLGKRFKTIWSGRTSDVQEAKLDLVWKIICKQADQIEQLKTELAQVKETMVIPEPIDQES